MHISSFLGLDTVGLLSILKPLAELAEEVAFVEDAAALEDVFTEDATEAFDVVLTVLVTTVLDTAVLDASTLWAEEDCSTEATELASDELVTSSDDTGADEDTAVDDPFPEHADSNIVTATRISAAFFFMV